MGSRFIIIGRSSCPFCIRSIDFCNAIGSPVIFLDYEENKTILEEYKQFHDHPTVPIILSNHLETGLTSKLGGFDELVASLK